jgi:TolB-like protein/DNA-binding winged helix-turn-helix (wHTH) protein/Flp pilus assembly protein TadD
MHNSMPGHVLRFGVFELDSASGELRRHGLKIRFPDQSFQILKELLRRPGEVVTREELRHVLWTADTFVDFEVGLNSAVRKLREALDDSAENPRFVETVPRRGYRFVATVTAPDTALEPVSEPALGPARVQASARAADQPFAPVSELALERASAPMSAPGAEQTSIPMAEPVPIILPRARHAASRAGALGFLVLVMAAAVAYQLGGFTLLRPGPAAAPIRSVVVLPFENLTGDPAQDDFTDIVSDAISVHLRHVAGLDVISRTSARHYKDSAKRAQAIAQELNVEGVVAGTVIRSAAGVGITVHLIRAATERDVWSETYQDDLRHMIGLQQRIASEIAVAAGRPALPPPTGLAATQPINPQAYTAYLKGMMAQGLQRYEGFRRAVTYFEEAVRVQPDFAEAHAALAFAQLQFLFGGPLSPHESMPKAEAAARRALQLDEALPRAHLVLGQIFLLYHWREEEGHEALARAATLQVGREELTAAITNSLKRRGRFEEAIAAAERARKLDPLSVGVQVSVGTTYRHAGQYDRAINELRQALEMSPGFPRAHFQIGVTFVAMGRFADAIPELEIAARPATGHNARIEAYLGYAYAAAGRTDDARAVLKELEAHRSEQYVSSFGIALIHDALGEKEPALAALRRAHQDHAVEFGMIDQHPRFRTIASDPGFQAVMRDVGIAR